MAAPTEPSKFFVSDEPVVLNEGSAELYVKFINKSENAKVNKHRPSNSILLLCKNLVAFPGKNLRGIPLSLSDILFIPRTHYFLFE